MKMRTTLRAVAVTAFCCAAVLFSVGMCQILGALPVGAGGYLDASFFIAEGIACLVFGAQAASMVRPPRQTRSTWASLLVVASPAPALTTHSALSRVTYVLCALGIAVVGIVHAALAWELAGYLSPIGSRPGIHSKYMNICSYYALYQRLYKQKNSLPQNRLHVKHFLAKR